MKSVLCGESTPQYTCYIKYVLPPDTGKSWSLTGTLMMSQMRSLLVLRLTLWWSFTLYRQHISTGWYAIFVKVIIYGNPSPTPLGDQFNIGLSIWSWDTRVEGVQVDASHQDTKGNHCACIRRVKWPLKPAKPCIRASTRTQGGSPITAYQEYIGLAVWSRALVLDVRDPFPRYRPSTV